MSVNYYKLRIVNSQPWGIDETGITHVDWAVSVAFTTTNKTVRVASGARYVCILNHTAAATDEPGVGVNFGTYWKLIAEPWSEYMEVTSASVYKSWYADGSTTPPTVRTPDASSAPEGTAVKSTGVAVGWFLQAVGDGTSIWTLLTGGGDLLADGSIPMTAGLKGFTGTAALPGYAFNGDINTGMYRIAANNLGVAAGGTKILDIDIAGVTISGQIRIDANAYFTLSGLNPTLYFDSTDYIQYGRASNTFEYVIGGTQILTAGLSGFKILTGARITQFDDDDTLAANSASRGVTQQAVKTYIDASNSSQVVHKGSYNATTNTPDLDTSPAALNILQGWMYTVTVAGTFFMADVEVGDVLIADQDAPTAEGHWTILNKNLDAASIKALYESNADTNEFDDAEKTKLSTVATNADVGDMLASTYDPTGVAGDAFSAANTKIALGAGSPTINTIQEYFDNTGSVGFLKGTGAITDAGGGNINVAAGSGFIRDSASSTAPLKSFKWSASAGIAIPTDMTRFVFVDNTGTVSVSADQFEEAENKILIGYAVNEGGSVVLVGARGVILDESIGNAGRFLRRVMGVSYDEARGGLLLAETGTRNITLSTGYLWDGRTEHEITAKDTSASDTFLIYSAGGQEDATATQWPNTEYDNGGVLTTMSNNRWANLFVFITTDGNVVMVYGRNQYTSQTLAEGELVPTSNLPGRITTAGILAARFTFLKSASTATIRTAFDANLPGSGSTVNEFLSSLFRIKDNTDETKKLAWNMSGVATGTTRTWTVPDKDINFGNVLISTEYKNLTNGFDTVSVNDGSKSSGTYTPSASGGNLKYITNDGNFTLDPMVNDGTVIVQITNHATTPGTIVTSNWTKVVNDAMPTAAGAKAVLWLTVNNSVKTMHITAI